MKIDSDPTTNHDVQVPSPGTINEVIETLREGKCEITREGEVLETGKVLGEGGSKTVIEVFIEGERLALALPNRADSGDKAREKWEGVLKEPENTQKIRDLGIPTNPLCERLQTELNGLPFDLVVMAPYDATGYEVRDRKNRHSSVMTSELLPDHLGVSNVRAAFVDLVADVETLIKAGVRVDSDSMNICKDSEGRLRLYLNDLGVAKFSPFDQTELREAATHYMGSAMTALINGLDEAEWSKHKKFLDGPEMNQYLGGASFKSIVEDVITNVSQDFDSSSELR